MNSSMIKYDGFSKVRTQLIVLSCALLIPLLAMAEEPQRELLWPLGAPGATGDDPKKDKPAITIYSPSKDTLNGTAIVICPGGGYGHLAVESEGYDIAKWLNALGITGVVLEYRMQAGGYSHPIPLQDAQRAIRAVRSRAEELHLNPSRIGIMGFSAGGHLASTAGTHFDQGNPEEKDPVDNVGCRPDFMILCYPVVAFGEPYTHTGSQHNLIGTHASEELMKSLSNEKQVTKDTPPTFLFHTDEDQAVPAENSVAFYLALRKAKVPAELHVYKTGRHGLNLARNVPGTSDWPRACEQWLRGQGLIQKTLSAQDTGESMIINTETVKQWSAPYRGWHYYPDHVIPEKPDIKGFEKVYMTDVPTVFQLPGDKKWYMTFIGFDGQGYQSFVAESDDLVQWTNLRLAMGFGPEGSFDYGGVVLGAFLYEDYDIKAPRVLKKRNGKYFSLYGSYPRQGGFELRPGYEGVASSDDGFIWQRAKDEPILSVHQPDCKEWEQDCIYQPWLVEHEGRFFNFYNAANGYIEQTGLALSKDLLEWERYGDNPVIPVGLKGSYNEVFSSDGKVFWDKDHWVNFFFGVNADGAHIMVAFSRDLYHWTVDPDPLYKSGGNPSGLDKEYAHKISLVWNPGNDTYYMFYNAVGNKGRGIGLITSKPIEQGAQNNPEVGK